MQWGWNSRLHVCYISALPTEPHPQSPTHTFKQTLKMYFCVVVLGIKPRASSVLNTSFTTELWAQLKTTIWWLPTVEHLSGVPLLNIAICFPTDDAWMAPRIRILVIHLVEIWWALTRDCSPVLTEGLMKPHTTTLGVFIVFPHCCEQLPGKSSRRKEGWGCSPSECGGKSVKQLVTWHPQSGSSEMNSGPQLTCSFSFSLGS